VNCTPRFSLTRGLPCCLGVSSKMRVPPSARLMMPRVRSSSKDENKVVPTRGFAPLASSIPTRRTSACASTAWPRELELNQRMQPSEGHCRCPPAARELAPTSGVEPLQPTFVASVPRFRRRRYLVAGLGIEPRSRANLALAGYKAAALPLSYPAAGGSGTESCTRITGL
jgi:hypothetical protein